MSRLYASITMSHCLCLHALHKYRTATYNANGNKLDIRPKNF